MNNRSNVKPLYYAGIGSRIANQNVLERLRRLSMHLAECGYHLRSGGADGADTACEIGAYCSNGGVELWLPWPKFKNREVGFYPDIQHIAIASTLHPIWDKLPKYIRYLHARNVGQILGRDCESPVEFVLCWTADGCESEATRTKHTGGTGTAITLASRRKIPIFNIYNEDAVDRLEVFLKTHLHYPSQYNDIYIEALKPKLAKDTVFVFGSNLAGRHGKGAAKLAMKSYGAMYGHGIGIQGNSYAIPTKDEHLNVLSLEEIKRFADVFIEYTKQESFYFYLTPIGCGLAGYTPQEIAPLFKGVQYCWLPDTWLPFIL
jgi:hypothetical protein